MEDGALVANMSKMDLPIPLLRAGNPCCASAMTVKTLIAGFSAFARLEDPAVLFEICAPKLD